MITQSPTAVSIFFRVDGKVRFTERAKSEAPFKHYADDEEHTVRVVRPVPDEYGVDFVARGLSSQPSIYADKKRREIVGHHQWVMLEDRTIWSGALLQHA